MIISPPFLAEHSGTENDADWVDRMMPVDMQRGYPVNALRAWHGGIHLTHSDSGSKPDPLRAIADGTVASMREASLSKRDAPPFNYSGGTDSGYVLLRHETEIGSGDEGKIVYYSLYMHLKSIDSKIAPGKSVYRKDPLGTVGMVDGKNASHFQIFCDDENIKKIVGRTEPELDLSIDGRTDVVYGDMHFYLPAGTAFYEAAPPMNAVTQRGEAKYTSMEPLFVTMSFDKGNCTMITRQKDVLSGGEYCVVGDILKNVDGDEYEYNLYKYALKLYPDSPSAGYELLRFGRVINTEYETLVPSDAPLWRTVNYPGGKGVVNLALSSIKKFSDGDFPHWIGWHLVDDDTDMNSQCTSPTILCNTAKDLSRMVCHFPLEWDLTTVEKRFEWLKLPNEALNEPMSECDWKLLTDYGKALCLTDNPLPAGRVWHFDPRQFIVHFRKCGWVDNRQINNIMTHALNKKKNAKKIKKIEESVNLNGDAINIIMRKYNILTPVRQSHFFGQGSVESDSLTSMQEVSQEQKIVDGKQYGGAIVPESVVNESVLGHWYGFDSDERDLYFSGTKYNKNGGYIAGSYSWYNGNCGDIDAQKFRGRGFKMLTGRDKYADYWVYRGFIAKNSFDQYWWDDQNYKKKNVSAMKKRPAVIDEPQLVTSTPYNCIDSGAFYIICFRKKTIREIDQDTNVMNDDDDIIKKVTHAINGAYKGLNKRIIMTNGAKNILYDNVK
ncbi:MAG: M23 family metallopeptidase [Hafnia paralvei]|jgi:predicted chitinase|uniref:M23 family metallopeptidase n=1 Tax=Hafnia paralvei TaxID=546367 RepID=UPI0015857D09|nr:M23 family metallopeptidase [Hafnia paralvei]NUN40878.1 M23 family metallopeptidase [Hafnia paralvei]